MEDTRELPVLANAYLYCGDLTLNGLHERHARVQPITQTLDGAGGGIPPLKNAGADAPGRPNDMLHRWPKNLYLEEELQSDPATANRGTVAPLSPALPGGPETSGNWPAS